MKDHLRAAIYLFLLVLLAPIVVNAPSTATGTVSGTISDPSQAVINGARVTITSVATGTERTTVTNSAGSYRFDLLAAGAYKLKIEGTGFSSASQSLELMVGQT